MSAHLQLQLERGTNRSRTRIAAVFRSSPVPGTRIFAAEPTASCCSCDQFRIRRVRGSLRLGGAARLPEFERGIIEPRGICRCRHLPCGVRAAREAARFRTRARASYPVRLRLGCPTMFALLPPIPSWVRPTQVQRRCPWGPQYGHEMSGYWGLTGPSGTDVRKLIRARMAGCTQRRSPVRICSRAPSKHQPGQAFSLAGLMYSERARLASSRPLKRPQSMQGSRAKWLPHYRAAPRCSRLARRPDTDFQRV